MEFSNFAGEISEIQETKEQSENIEFSKEALDKFDKLFETGDFFRKGHNSEKEELNNEQKEEFRESTGWSDEIWDAVGSLNEAEIYMEGGLKETEINGRKCLIRDDIDLDWEDEDGITNRDRMERGRPPITKDGEEVELHHIGQKQTSPLAELTMEQHRGGGNDTILHDKTKETEIDRNEFGKERREHWKDRVESLKGEK